MVKHEHYTSKNNFYRRCKPRKDKGTSVNERNETEITYNKRYVVKRIFQKFNKDDEVELLVR